MDEFILYGVPASPYVRSAALGLEEKGAPFRVSVLALFLTANYLWFPHGPKRCRYSPDVMNAFTISASTKLPLN